MHEHIPGIFHESQPLTEEVLTLRNMVRLVNLCGDVEAEELSTDQTEAASVLAGTLGAAVPEVFQLKPINSVGLLGHWKALTSILSLVGVEVTRQLQENFGKVFVKDLPEAVDSHFHMDRLCKKTGLEITAFRKTLEKTTDLPGGELVRIVGAVTVFCDPPAYPTPEQVEELGKQGVVTCIGIHPKGAAHLTPEKLEAFEKALQIPGVRGLGEVGLDLTSPQSEWDDQHLVLDKVLKHLTLDRVLVLHNRTQEASHENVALFYHLKGVIPVDQPIHYHCFLETPRTVRLWADHFSNVYFGFTSGVQHAPEKTREGVRLVNPARLLLETDAPYFKANRAPYSAPASVALAAQAVAEIRGEQWEDTLRAANANARRLYQM